MTTLDRSGSTTIDRSSGTTLDRSSGGTTVDRSSSSTPTSSKPVAKKVTLAAVSAGKLDALASAKVATARLLGRKMPTVKQLRALKAVLFRTRLLHPLKGGQVLLGIKRVNQGKALRSKQRSALQSYKGWIGEAIQQKAAHAEKTIIAKGGVTQSQLDAEKASRAAERKAAEAEIARLKKVAEDSAKQAAAAATAAEKQAAEQQAAAAAAASAQIEEQVEESAALDSADETSWLYPALGLGAAAVVIALVVTRR